MSEDDTTRPAVEMQPARIILVNGIAFDVQVPADEHDAYTTWLRLIQADRVALFPALTIATAAIAAIVRGEALQRLLGPMGSATMPPSGRFN